jgi:DNA-binding NarL/FixJ family response regulator
VLLEREREVARLDEFVSAVGKVGPRLGLIEGPAGIGKTSLLAEARRLAESDGVRVLSARGSQLERGFPFGVVRQLFEPILAADADARERAFAGAAEAARPVFATTGEIADSLDGFAALHGLYWLVLNLAGDDPLVLVIDDLHWADHPSLRFIAYLVHRLEGVGVLVVAGVRPNEPGADVEMLAELASDPLTATLHPGVLSTDAVRALVAERLDGEVADTFVTACHAATGGNPLLLQELLRALAAERVEPRGDQVGVVADLGPRAASRAVLLRLARLPGEAAQVARAVAVLDEGAELWAVAQLAGLSEEAAAEATGALASAEILRPDPPLGFVHPLVRDAVYLELSPGDRELQHARAAELLNAAGSPPEEVAAHVLAAPGVEGDWVVETLRSAAASARRRGAGESAIPYLERALEEPLEREDRAQVLRALGSVEVQHLGQKATMHLMQAYEELTDSRERAEVAMLLAWAQIFTRRQEEAHRLASRAKADAPEDPPDLRQGFEALILFTLYFGAGDYRDLARFDRYRDFWAVDTAGAAMLAGGTAFDWANTLGPREKCVALARKALAMPDLYRYDQGMFWCGASLVLVYAEEPDALSNWDAALADVYRDGSLFAALTASLWGGYTEMLWGRLDEAMARFERAEEQGMLWGAGTRIDHVPAAFMAQILVERGEVAAARQALEISTLGEPPIAHFAGNLWRRAQVEVLAAEGRLPEALEAAERLRDAAYRFDNPAGYPWRTVMAEVLDRLERLEEAAELAAAELELAREWGAPGAIGRALRVLGTAQREDGLQTLEEAVAVLEQSHMQLELAKALYALGVATRLARRPTDAREPLQRALELAITCGSTTLAEKARTELAATGVRPRREALSGVGALTPSERRVADLAAAGRTNREIAQELYVTPKTVEVHLSNAYRKLDIRGRRELAVALAT